MADIQQDLFSPEEMRKIENSNLHRQQGPVKCLGMEFENNEVRRTYFREELRKKLPELRKIEGFPIGEDDDIINLSDPPYYTACPNPWLNDFITEWEKEKEQLENEGKRKKDFEVKEPYASDVSEGKNNPIYNAHSYHTKVPHPAIMRYILHYTQPGDIIYDGFAGTGMTGVAASLCDSAANDVDAKIQKEFSKRGEHIIFGKRHAFLSDLSPSASLISAVYNTPLDINYAGIISGILEDCKKKYGWMYETKHTDGNVAKINYTVWSDVFICPHCGKEVVFTNAAFDKKNNKVKEQFLCPSCHSHLTKKTLDKCWATYYDPIIGETIQQQKKVPVFINYSVGRKSYTKELDEFDYNCIKRADDLASSFTWVKERMMEGSEARRNDRQGLTHVHHFYFSKALVILEYILSECDSKEVKFWINSQLINISKLNRFRPGISFPYNPLSGTLYIGSQISEANVFVALENKLNKLSNAFNLLDADNVSSIESATCSNLPNNSIDYIFTDPPFGANISYSELNFIQESWLKVKTNNKEEAIVNESLQKTRNTYQSLMTKSLMEYYRVLKPNKWITIEFSNTSASIWNAIQRAIDEAGFMVTSVASLDKQTGSFKAVTTTTAVKQDLIITCYKPSDIITKQLPIHNSNKDYVWDFLSEHLGHLPVHIERGNTTTTVVERSPKILYDRLISYYVQHGYQIPMDAQEFQAGLRERFIERDGMYFTAPQAAEYEEKRKHTTDFVPMGLIVSDEANGIEWLKLQLKEPKTYQEISPEWMQAVNGLRKGDVLPELKDILEENFIEDENGRWHVPDLEKQIDLEKLKHKSLMKEFNLYREMAQKPRARIKEVRVEALREGFKQCFKDKDFATILLLGDKIPQNILTEDEVLLQYYDIAQMRS